MAIDAYSLCPGGSGKKIKFCCPEFFPELEKIDRLLEGDQSAAAVEHVERLQTQPQNRDRACLMAMKADALFNLGRQEEAMANAVAWVEKHPDNQDAHAELAMLRGMAGGCRLAMPELQKAITLSGNTFGQRVMNAVSMVAQIALYQREYLPVGPLTDLLVALDPENPNWAKLRAAFTHDANVPLLLREMPEFHPLPEDSPLHARFNAALENMAKCSWQETLPELEAMLAEAPDSPVLWKALAYAKGWLLDIEGCREALTKYASLDIPLDEAVAAETLAMALSPDPLGDNVEICDFTWEVADCDRLWEQIVSSDRAQIVPPEEFRTEDGAMPRGALMFFDRPVPSTPESVTVETVQRLVGLALLYGRQTDREARIEAVNLIDDEAPGLRAWLDQIAPGAIAGEPVRIVRGMVSPSYRLALAELRLPETFERGARRTIVADYFRKTLFEQWPQVKLGCLGGRSLAEAAALPEYRLKTLAAIRFMQGHLDDQDVELDWNTLRTSLGLPVVEPIGGDRVEEALSRPSELYRLRPESLEDSLLEAAMRVAILYDLKLLMPKFAKEIASRPSFSGTQSRQRALQVLSQMADTYAESIAYLQEGRQAAEAAGQPSGQWHLMEMYAQMAQGDAQGAQATFEHLYRTHSNEPGVRDALRQFLINSGAMRPDGTINPQFAPAASAAQQAAPQQSGLWTPESQQPSPGGGKLWVPE